MRSNVTATQPQQVTALNSNTATAMRQQRQQSNEATRGVEGTDVLNLHLLRELLNNGWNCNTKVYYQEDGEWRQTLVWYAVHFDKQEALRILLNYRGGGNESLVPNAETLQLALRHSKNRCRYGCTLLIEAEIRKRRGEEIGTDFHLNLIQANAPATRHQTSNSRNPSSNRGYEYSSSTNAPQSRNNNRTTMNSSQVNSSEDEMSILSERFENIDREATRSGLSRLPELLIETRNTIHTLRQRAVNKRVEIFEIESILFAKKRELEQAEGDIGKLEVLALDLETYIGTSRQGSPASVNVGSEKTNDETVTCNICQERKKNRALNCGHVFCSDCVRHCQEGNNACFVCRKAISHVITIYL